MTKAKSRIKKQRRDYHGKFTARMSWKERLFIVSLLLGSMLLGYYNYSRNHVRDNSDVINKSGEQQSATPSAEVQEISISIVEEVEAKTERDADYLVGFYVDKYFQSDTQRSEMRMIMHCLLHRESNHYSDNNHGDGGLAGGPLQFHQATWVAYRKIMMEGYFVSEIGSRYDLEQAIETAVWAISDGRGLAWGPILRNSRGNNYASCQTPSWY